MSEEKNSVGFCIQKHDRSDLQKWPILEMLSAQFLENIYMAFVYGSQALLVTNNDKVYAIGKNSLGCSPGGTIGENFFHPREVEELNGVEIKSFHFCADSTVVALTKNGTMYYTEGVSFVKLETEQQNNKFSQKMVVRTIACQPNHIFALLQNGEVYILKKDASLTKIVAKQQITFPSKTKIIHIEANYSSCITLTTEGDLYVFNNDNQGYRMPRQANGLLPESLKKISFPIDVKIEKIACGYQHTLALSDSGDVFSWGANDSGQLGCLFGSAGSAGSTLFGGNNIIQEIPQKVLVRTKGRVIDIAATNHCSISVAATSCGEIFMWGDCNGVTVKTPILTPYDSFHDVFVKFARVKLMHRPLIGVVKHENSNIFPNLESAFDDPETSDFIIEVEGKPIHVHKAILKINSDYFRRMFATDWAENTKDVIEHKEFSYDVYKAFLKFLYTGRVNLALPDVLELFPLAHQYLDYRLQRCCVEKITNGLSVSNAIRVFVTARQYTIEDLEHTCTGFILNNLTAVVESEDFLSVDGEIVKELVRQAAKKGIFKK